MARQDTSVGTDTSTGSGGTEVVHDPRGTGVTPMLLGVGLLTLLFVVFLAQSVDDVPIEFLLWEGEAPLYVVLLVTMTVTALATLAIAGLWRRRRRRHRTERDELDHLRGRR